MEKENVVVTDIKMPFISMVVFMVKWAVASIPAIITQSRGQSRGRTLELAILQGPSDLAP